MSHRIVPLGINHREGEEGGLALALLWVGRGTIYSGQATRRAHFVQMCGDGTHPYPPGR